MFGMIEVLTPAIKLTALPGIYVDDSVDSVKYFHLLFDHHQMIFAENAPTESLFIGPEALESLGTAVRREIFGIFPELADLNHIADPARLIPRGRLQAQLVTRHLKKNNPCCRRLRQAAKRNSISVQRFRRTRLDPLRDSHYTHPTSFRARLRVAPL